MYDRMLKAELMNSDRWLDLQSDSHRLAYICLLPLADDFGNFEAGTRRLWRYLHARTQIKDEAHAVKVLSDLMDADLIRPYKVMGTDYWHIPRFECDRRYICRRVPASEWDDPELERRAKHYSAYHKARRIESKAKKGKSDQDLTINRPRSDAVQGEGVGVGVGVYIPTNAIDRARKKPCAPEYPPDFQEFWTAYPKKKSKDAAYRAWKARRPDRAMVEVMLTALAALKSSAQWTEAGGRFIPYPSTWLNAGGWQDEIDSVADERGFVS